MTQTPSTPTAAAGQTVTFTVDVTNNGPSSAASIVLTDELPHGTTDPELSGTLSSCTVAGDGTVTCSAPALASGETAALMLTIATDPGSPSGSLTNSATVSSSVPDPNLTNNTSTLQVELEPSAALALTETSNGPDLAGSTVGLLLQVSNAGPSDAAAPITVVVDLPAGLIYESDTGSGWSCLAAASSSGQSVSCTSSSPLGVDSSAGQLEIVAQIAPSVAPETQLITQASVTSGTPDPDASNDVATETLVVSSPDNGTAASPPTSAQPGFPDTGHAQR